MWERVVTKKQISDFDTLPEGKANMTFEVAFDGGGPGKGCRRTFSGKVESKLAKRGWGDDFGLQH